MLKKDVLSSGLRVVSKYLPNTQSVTVLILVGAGSRYEVKEISGISHFLEHMFFKGAEKYKNTKEVSEAIDSVGGDFNAFTGKEYAGYYVKVASANWKIAVDVLSDMLINSKFDPAEIDKERGVILEEYNMYQDTPMYQIGWDFERLMYGDQPLGWDQVGTKEVINALTQEQFLKYLRELYTPDNTVIAIAGNIDHDQAMAELERSFVFPENRQKKAYDFLPVKDADDLGKVWLREKKTEQAHVMIGVPGYQEGSEDYYAARLLAVILGGNMSSRMFLSVREAQGLAYYISTSTDEYADTGTFSTSAGVSVDRIDQAIISIIAEYKLAAEGGVTAEELAKAKAYLKGKIVLRLEDSEEYSHLIGKYELLQGKQASLEEVLQKIEAVELDQVNKVAADLLREDKLKLAVIGPYDDKTRFEKLLKF
jgi:predicted Zn-dependent peptidase